MMLTATEGFHSPTIDYREDAIRKIEVAQQSEARSGGRRLIVQCAADVAVQPIEWLWPSRVAIGKLTLVAGEAGLGKSQVSIAMAAAVTTSGSWPWTRAAAPLGNVIFFSAEDGAADTIVPRLVAAALILGASTL